MNDVPSVPIGDFENTLSFPSEETSLGQGGFPHISPREMYHAHPSLLTVFSITQSARSITQSDSCHHGFADAYNANFDREMSVWYKVCRERKMKRLPSLGYIFCLLVILVFPNCETEGSLTRKRIDAVENGLLRTVVFKGENPERMKLSDRMAFYRVPGVSIAVIDKSAIEWAQGYGVERIGTDLSVTPDMLFQAASISQSVAAWGILHLVELGKIDLDVDVNAHLKSWKIPASSVTRETKTTPRHLLSHSAGLISLKLAGYPFGKTMPTVLDVLQGQKPSDSPGVYVYNEPGTEVQYSELGYAVLHQLLEDIEGKPFHQVLTETVFQPLQMNQSTFEIPLPDIMRTKAVAGHTRQGDPVKEGWFYYPVAAASGLWSTSSDLCLFVIDVMKTALGQSQTVVSPESARMMLAPQLGNQGLGVEIFDTGENLYFSQRGSTEGYECCMVAYPSRGQGVVIMANSGNGAYLIDEILRSISDAYKWPHFIPEIKTYYRLDPSVYAQYVGTYEVRPDYILNVTHEDYYLVIQPTGQAPTKFFVESQSTFFSIDPYIQIQFLKDTAGSVTGLLLTQRGQTSEARKIE
ncbi:MAG TPA: serine hydrolase domain-containing protein [Candidatus Heimdallarchaeota archaeon]|nr:serine hydrolase domain-containing protein [Candidatus Heimdallarchaeota archaeon]